MKKYTISALFMMLLSGCSYFAQTRPKFDKERYLQMVQGNLKSLNEVMELFPKTIDEVKQRSATAIAHAQEQLDAFLAIPAEKRNFQNTAEAYDSIGNAFSIEQTCLHLLEEAAFDENLQKAAEDVLATMRQFAVEAFSNKKIYQAFEAYLTHAGKTEVLGEEEKFYLSKQMDDFKRSGFHLDNEPFEKVKVLRKELTELENDYSTEIRKDASVIYATKDELAGVSNDMIQQLPVAQDGKFILTCDYPVYYEVRSHCSVPETRKRHYHAFQNRAHPANDTRLKTIIKKRDELARLLGFQTYADLDTDNTMVKKPATVKQFLKDVLEHAVVKLVNEFDKIKQTLPSSVVLTKDGKLNPWDVGFSYETYKKEALKFNEHECAEYFPVEKTLEGIFLIYQQFLGVDFNFVKPKGSWHEDVGCIEVRDKADKRVLGYIFLDLYPRPRKYKHACCMSIVAPRLVTDKNGTTSTPAVCAILANVPRPTAGKPALLKHSDLTTFFHEFGHAMHVVLGATKYAEFAGYAVKWDFVEMPSQMFEEWMWEPEMLKLVSSHYKTGAKLSDALIESLLATRTFDSGFSVCRQGVFASVSLECFSHADSDPHTLEEKFTQKYLPIVRFDDNSHFTSAFGHLIGYGTKYYGYLWSKVFSADLFYMVREQGLLDDTIGRRFAKRVLGVGGSVEPNEILREFLGRDPNQRAFFDLFGFEKIEKPKEKGR